MGTVWIVIIDILIALFCIFGMSGIWLIVKHHRFVVPFTDKMIEQGVIEPSMRKQLLFSDGFSSYFTAIALNALCILGAYFARPSGIIVYLAFIVISLLFFRPSPDRYSWGPLNIEEYVRLHSVCMDKEKFDEAEFNVFQ